MVQSLRLGCIFMNSNHNIMCGCNWKAFEFHILLRQLRALLPLIAELNRLDRQIDLQSSQVPASNNKQANRDFSPLSLSLQITHFSAFNLLASRSLYILLNDIFIFEVFI